MFWSVRDFDFWEWLTKYKGKNSELEVPESPAFEVLPAGVIAWDYSQVWNLRVGSLLYQFQITYVLHFRQ